MKDWQKQEFSHCIHMLSVLEKKLFFFCGYHLIQCHSHITEVIIYFGTEASKRINVKTKHFETSWYLKKKYQPCLRPYVRTLEGNQRV